MLDAFGPTKIEGHFRRACEIVMRIMRDKKEMLSTVLNAFVHDPLLEFIIEQRNQQFRNQVCAFFHFLIIFNS